MPCALSPRACGVSLSSESSEVCLSTAGVGATGPRTVGCVRRIDAPAGARRIDAPAGARRIDAPAGARRIDAPAGARRIDAPAGARRIGAPAGARRIDAPAGARRIGVPAGARQHRFGSRRCGLYRCGTRLGLRVWDRGRPNRQPVGVGGWVVLLDPSVHHGAREVRHGCLGRGGPGAHRTERCFDPEPLCSGERHSGHDRWRSARGVDRRVGGDAPKLRPWARDECSDQRRAPPPPPPTGPGPLVTTLTSLTWAKPGISAMIVTES